MKKLIRGLSRGAVVGLLLLFFLLLNAVGMMVPGFLDLTPEKRYTLSTVSRQTLDQLDEVTTVSVYASANMPYRFRRRVDMLRGLLQQMQAYSQGNLVFEFPDPGRPNAIDKPAAQAEGLKPVVFRMRKEDQVRQSKGYLGLVVRSGTSRQVVPYLDPNESIEYTLTKALASLQREERRPKIYWLEGYGSVPLGSTGKLPESLGGILKLVSWPIEQLAQLPKEAQTLALVSPRDSLPAQVREQLDHFLGRGGNLLVASSTAEALPSDDHARLRANGLSAWLRRLGLRLSPNLVVDRQCGEVMVRFVEDGGSAQQRLSFPFFPAIRDFAQHPVTHGLREVLMPFAAQVGTYPHLAKEVKGSMLMVSSSQSGRRTLPTPIDLRKRWQPRDFQAPQLPVGLAVEGPLLKNAPDVSNRMVLLGSGGFIEKQGGPLPPDNIALAANALEWLSASRSYSVLREKKAITPTLPKLDDSQRQWLKVFNFIGPLVLLILAWGIQQVIRRRRIHILQRMAP